MSTSSKVAGKKRRRIVPTLIRPLAEPPPAAAVESLAAQGEKREEKSETKKHVIQAKGDEAEKRQKKKARIQPTLISYLPQSTCENKTSGALSSSESAASASALPGPKLEPSANAKSVKRRIQPTLVQALNPSPSVEPDVLSVLLSRRNPCRVHTFQKTPNAPTELVSSHADLQLLLHNLAETCMKSRHKWMRDPQAKWVQTLFSELSPNMDALVREAHRQLNVNPAASVEERWYARSEFATKIIECWFEGKTLDDVIAKSRELGQDDLPHGYVLTGDAVLRLGLNQNIRFDQLFPLINAFLSPRQSRLAQEIENKATADNSLSYSRADTTTWYDASLSRSLSGFPATTPTFENASAAATSKIVSLYQNTSENSFKLEPEDRYTLEELKEKCKQGRQALRGCGSLNTTFDYGSFSGDHTELPDCDMLHSFYRDMNELTEEGGVDAVELNQKLYLIWKLRDYVTPHHQDTHVVPHFTLYSQTSGASVFHFLPVLVGLYVAHRGAKNPEELKQLMARLDDMGMGSIGALGPGQLALIMPSGSHGVFVPPVDPYPGLNSRVCAPFDVSLIRAAEFYLSALREELFSRDYLGSHKWNTVLNLSEEEEKIVQEFMKHQQGLISTNCKSAGNGALVKSREEWFWAAQQCWQRWERENTALGSS